tara:strand:+ start:20038 stop:20721 length:684 start_codon:yes stop_codon:yes gene_type:complete
MSWLDYSKNFKNNKIKALFSILTETNEETLSRTKFAKLANFNPLKLIVPNQTHSVNVDLIKEPGYFDNIDGVFTSKKELVCTLQVADCLPIYFAHTSSDKIGLVHAGWRGLANGIIKSVEFFFLKNNWSISDFNIVIGPSIHSCCFVVKEDVIKQIDSEFYQKINRSQFSVDLQSWAINQLLGLGAKSENIVSVGDCTCCLEDRFYSYRREGLHARRMLALIGLVNK